MMKSRMNKLNWLAVMALPLLLATGCDKGSGEEGAESEAEGEASLEDRCVAHFTQSSAAAFDLWEARPERAVFVVQLAELQASTLQEALALGSEVAALEQSEQEDISRAITSAMMRHEGFEPNWQAAALQHYGMGESGDGTDIQPQFSFFTTFGGLYYQRGFCGASPQVAERWGVDCSQFAAE